MLPHPLPPHPPHAVIVMAAEVDSIGDVIMRPDGTLILSYRINRPDGSVGDGRIVYLPAHQDYQKVLEFLGGLKPGEYKPLPRVGPFGDAPPR